jgi:threonine dehydrogenase-like Zn-dependent dehydrogenase
MQLWNWRGLDVINAHERDARVYVEGMRAAASAIAGGQLDPSPLYTDQFKLEELPDAFGRMRSRDGSYLKALLRYD